MKHNAVMRYSLVAGVALVAGLLLAGTPWRSLLPLVLLLARPLMMVFMMRGIIAHGHGGVSGPRSQDHPDRDDADSGRRL